MSDNVIDTEHQRLVDVMEFPENVRTNSAMYIGDRENAGHILREIIDNSVDEALDENGTCDTIQIFQGKPDAMDTRWFAVVDNGRGIPLIESPKKPGTTMAKLAVSQLSSGSNFVGRKGERTSIGMNGVGSACCNACSNHFYLIISMKSQGFNIPKAPKDIQDKFNAASKEIQENGYYICEFARGILEKEEFIDKAYLDSLVPEFELPAEFGTTVIFQPDTNYIFTRTDSNPVKDLRYLQPFLTKIKGKELRFFINGEEYKSDWTPHKFECTVDVESSIEKVRLQRQEEYETLPEDQKAYYKVPIEPRNKSASIYVTFEVNEEEMSPAEFTGSVNGLIVPGRVHTQWVRSAFSEAMKMAYSFDFRGREFGGMRFDVIFNCVFPEFNSQTKETLVRVDGIQASDVIPKLVQEFLKIIKMNHKVFDAHAERVKALLMTMQNMSLIDYVKAKVPTSSDNRRYKVELSKTKLKDARSTNRKICELYIAEGDSAGEPIEKARDPNIHAVLPLRGKPKNVVSKGIEDVIENEELKAIYLSIGAGTDQNPDLEGCRYGKIIIASDADKLSA